MFGYVRINKGELLVREYEAYRGVYCSLCRALGKRYGVFSRLILSYDMTFFAMVRFAAKGILPQFRPGRCPFNPAKKCNYCTNASDVFDDVCAAAILMFYYKVRDNLSDAPVWKRPLFLMLLPYAAWKRKKARRRFVWMDDLLSDAMKAQSAIEQAGTDSFDRAAHPSADALGKLFSFGTAEKQDAYYRFGYFVGRWVYLTDAADDLKDDLKHHAFNVFVNAFSLTSRALSAQQAEDIRATLNVSTARAIEALDATGLTVMKPILENILYDGMQITCDSILKGNDNDERSL